MRVTKEQMVKDIFFDFTNGKRNTQNFVNGMWLIETIAKNNYAWAIKEWFESWQNQEKTAQEIFEEMIDITYMNTSGVNGYTEVSKRVMDVYWMFK